MAEKEIDAVIGPVGPTFDYCRGVDDLLWCAKCAQETLSAGARDPSGVGVNTVRAFVMYLGEQAKKLKGDT